MTMTMFHVFLMASSSAAAACCLATARVRAFLSVSCAYAHPPLSKHPPRAIRQIRRGGVSNVDRDGKNTLEIKVIGVAISTFEPLPLEEGPVPLCVYH